MSQIRPQFGARPVPTDPTIAGVLALDDDVARVLDRLLACDDDTLQQLRVVASRQAIVVLGEAERLPWVDGALYLERRGELLMPPWSTVSAPPDALASALRAAHPELRFPVAIATTRQRIISVAQACSPDRTHLARLHHECT